ncbi:MAG: flippase [Desulfobacteraceae bacterium]|nr:flippase [Desulfobacteraceae bacterium]MBC2748986.1 flippase [Desulfobacteraceae bacterium]
MIIQNKSKFLLINAFNSFVLNIISTLLLFISSIFYARILGANEYGIYLYFSSWVAILGIPVGLGTREYFVREAAVIYSSSDNARLQQLVTWGSISVTQSYIATAIVASFVAWKFDILVSETYLFTFLAALPLVLIAAQTGIRFAVLRGLNQIVLAQIPESLFKPLFQIILVFFAWLYFHNLNSWNIMLLATICAGCAFLFSNLFLHRIFPSLGSIIPISKEQKVRWFRSTLPFMLISGLFLLNNQINIIMLGSMGPPRDAAVFRVASYGAEFISFILMAANISIAPTIAQLWQNRDIGELQKMITKSVRTVVLFSLPLTTVLFLLSDRLLALFGVEFVQGIFVMKLLCLAQFFNTAVGSVGLILNMCNSENLTAWGVGLSFLLNILFNWYLIPQWGINGAAIATTISLTTWNIFLLFSVRKITGIKPTVFGL